jgi:hypothetical protein
VLISFILPVFYPVYMLFPNEQYFFQKEYMLTPKLLTFQKVIGVEISISSPVTDEVHCHPTLNFLNMFTVFVFYPNES